MGPDLTPILSGQNAARSQYASRMATNTFEKNRAKTMGQRKVTDFRTNFGRQLPSFSAGFARRGLSGPGIQSGVMKRAMNNYVGDYTRDLGRMTADNSDNLRQFDFSAGQYAADRDSTLASLEAQKAALIAGTAQHILGLKPLMGSY